MSNTNQRRGYVAECRARSAFEFCGYVVWKSGGSRSPADLIAAKPGQLVLIQVKGGRKPVTHEGWNDLYRIAAWLGAVPLVADWPTHTGVYWGRMRLIRPVAEHQEGRQTWPATGFVLDEVEAAARADGAPRV